MRAALVVLAISTCLLSCRTRSEEPPPAQEAAASPKVEDALVAPQLPEGDAGRLIARAMEVAGGWQTWRAQRDVSFISTLTLFDPRGNAVSETIFLHRMPLHQGIKTRVDSIGMDEEVLFAFDGEHEWMIEDGREVTAPPRISFTRFHALSTAYWFSLPFILGELPGDFSYLGVEEDGERKFEKVRVGYADSVPVPFDWIVLYFDADTGKLDHIHVHALAEFLQHSLFVGIWRDEREIGGIQVNRHRAYFYADAAGEIAGGMVGEQLTEHVEFDRGLAPELLELPPGTHGLTAQIQS